jgi:hypothetical protein
VITLKALRYWQAGDAVHLPTGTVVTAAGLARDQSPFAHRLAPSSLRPMPGARVQAFTHDLGDGQFTNIYDLSVDPKNCAVRLTTGRRAIPLRAAAAQAAPGQRPAVGFSGTFEFISDDPSYQPIEHVLDLSCSGGVVRGLPTVTKPAAVISDGAPRVMRVQAEGRLSVGGRDIAWVGSKDARGRRRYLEHAVVFGVANCRVRYRANPRTGYLRYVARSETRTPLDPARTDLGVVVTGKVAEVRSIRPGGGSDLFASSYVLSLPAARATLVTTGEAVVVRSIGGLDPSGASMCSLGPSLTQAAAGDTAAYDDSLGASPFAAKTYARMVVSFETRRLRIRIMDAAPLTESFRGVTPEQARDICQAHGFDPARSFHLDGGQTPKIAVVTPEATRVIGNMHYLRWPASADGPFRWIGQDGRGLHSAFIVTSRDR